MTGVQTCALPICEREKHYRYYTNRNWKDFSHYELVLNVDTFGVEKTAEIIKEAIEKRKS